MCDNMWKIQREEKTRADKKIPKDGGEYKYMVLAVKFATLFMFLNRELVTMQVLVVNFAILCMFLMTNFATLLFMNV